MEENIHMPYFISNFEQKHFCSWKNSSTIPRKILLAAAKHKALRKVEAENCSLVHMQSVFSMSERKGSYYKERK